MELAPTEAEYFNAFNPTRGNILDLAMEMANGDPSAMQSAALAAHYGGNPNDFSNIMDERAATIGGAIGPFDTALINASRPTVVGVPMP